MCPTVSDHVQSIVSKTCQANPGKSLDELVRLATIALGNQNYTVACHHAKPSPGMVCPSAVRTLCTPSAASAEA